MLKFDPKVMGLALTLMWQGMLGIMAVMLLIALIVWVITKFAK